MTALRSLAAALVVAACLSLLTACSVETIIWGRDGAQIIRTTDTLIEDISSVGTTDLVCDDIEKDVGLAQNWEGLSAGEPERFVARYWDDQALLDPQWNINLEGISSGEASVDKKPSDVFFRETDEGFCVVDIVWSTVIDAG